MRFCWIWRGRGSEEFRSRLTSFGRDVAALRLRAASCEPALAHSRRHRRNPSVPSVSICGQPQAGLPAQRVGSSKELRVASLPSRTAEGTGATHLCPSVDNSRRACPPNEWEAQKSCELRACPRAQPKAQAQPICAICVHLWTTPGGPARPTSGKLKRAASFEPALAHSRRHRRNPSVPSVSICGQPQAGLPAQRVGSSKELRVASLPSRTAEGTGATHLCHLWTTPGGPARPTRRKLKRAASFEPALAHSRRHRRNPSVPSVSICGQPQAGLPAQRVGSSKELRVASLPSRTAEGTGATHLCHLCPSVDNPRRACPPNEAEAQNCCEFRACPRAQPKAQAQPICVHLCPSVDNPRRACPPNEWEAQKSCELRACPRAQPKAQAQPICAICGQPQAGLPAQRVGSSKELRVASLPSRTAEGTGATHLCHLCPSVDNPRRACPPNEWEAQKSCELRACPRAQPKAQAQPICAICGQPQAGLPAQRGESSKELRVSSLPSRTAEGTGATHLCHLCPSVDNPRRACPPNEWEAQKSCELRACPRAQPKAQAQPICVHLWTTPGGPARPTSGKLKRAASCEPALAHSRRHRRNPSVSICGQLQAGLPAQRGGSSGAEPKRESSKGRKMLIERQQRLKWSQSLNHE
jgi:ribosomal protein L34E